MVTLRLSLVKYPAIIPVISVFSFPDIQYIQIFSYSDVFSGFTLNACGAPLSCYPEQSELPHTKKMNVSDSSVHLCPKNDGIGLAGQVRGSSEYSKGDSEIAQKPRRCAKKSRKWAILTVKTPFPTNIWCKDTTFD